MKPIRAEYDDAFQADPRGFTRERTQEWLATRTLACSTLFQYPRFPLRSDLRHGMVTASLMLIIRARSALIVTSMGP